VQTALRLPALILLAAFAANALASSPEPATCGGSTPCKACKTCEQCRYCHKLGGYCGVCSKSIPERPTDQHHD
jgi:hypothetical protein